MSSQRSLRTPLACVLILSLFVTGLITTRQSYASNSSLPRSLTPSISESSEETAPQANTVDEATRSRVHEAYGKLPLSFEENRGQVDKEVKYLARGSGYTLFLTPTEAVLTLRKADKSGRNKKQPRDLLNPQSTIRNPQPAQSAVLRMKLSGANPSPSVRGEREMGVRTNYFIGNDPAKWQTDVARYERVRYEQVYPGIDMIYYGQQQQLEYDFEVVPGADSRRIALQFTGVKRVKIERGTGELVLKTASGEVRQHKPVAYQEVGGRRREVESRYVMQGQGKVGIEVGEYDRTKRLVIDPTLSYSTYLGGNGDDQGYGIAVDTSGHVYVTGYTESPDFPTLHQYQTYQGDGDAFVTKLDTNLSGAASLLYSTYLGGSSHDYGSGIAVDTSGHVYVTGSTSASDFPVSNNAYQYTFQGGYSDAFVTKLDTNLSGAASLLYSTYLGGDAWDGGRSIAIDASGRAYVTGFTNAEDFPVLNAYQDTFQGGQTDAFVTKLDTNLSGAASLLYSTYLGGNDSYSIFGSESGSGIAADASGCAYVTGSTNAEDFPTLNALYTLGGLSDAFVTKLDTNASGTASLIYSTYLGGSDDFTGDYGNGIAVDASGCAYVTGSTSASDFPVSNNAYQYTFQGGYTDAFVTKLDANGESLLYSTYLGGSGGDYDGDYGYGIAVDSSGHAYVTGYTETSDFPVLNAYQDTFQGGYTDAFVTKLDTNAFYGESLIYSTYLGGSDDNSIYNDYGAGIAVDSLGNAYVVGITASTDFPTLNEYQTNQGGDDAFVTKLTIPYSISGRVTSDGTTSIGGVTVTLGGSQSRTAITSSNGHYSFTDLPPGGNFTVTPNKSGLTFFPSEKNFTNLLANQRNVNFTTQAIMISGKVTLDTGAGLAGVTITLTSGAGFTPRTVNTARDGTYSFSSLPTAGSYRITASKTSYNFTPAQLILKNVTVDQTNMNFVAALNISGVVKLGTAGLSGVTVKLTSPTPAGFTPRTMITDGNGEYSFANVPAGRNYTVTPQKTGYQLTPTSRSLTNLSANQTVSFLVKVYAISGRVTRTGTTTGISSVTMTLTSPTPGGFPARTVQTTSAGYYKFTTLPAGRNYTIKPMKTGFTFSPATRSITNLSNNIPVGASTSFTGTGP